MDFGIHEVHDVSTIRIRILACQPQARLDSKEKVQPEMPELQILPFFFGPAWRKRRRRRPPSAEKVRAVLLIVVVHFVEIDWLIYEGLWNF